MVAAYLFLAAYLALAQVGSQVLPAPSPPAQMTRSDAPADTGTARDGAALGEQVASARP
ncbi:hypothetical protein [Ideonella sp. BN130291]|uniref:hypothetical protein n=1 Tax=Ideonella sp. BN130291 TaxID=3112940 RepID=UPI002E26ED62|nr:hypothetical protein [Ideonella sp. BN130291]